MPSLRSLLLAALLGLCLTTPGLHAAEAPSRENVQRSLDGLADLMEDADGIPWDDLLP